MFSHYRSQAFVFKKEDRGEADQLFSIYTKDFGRLEILGKGIRKISSKLRPGVEIFYLSEIEFIQGRTYKTLTDAILLERFRYLRENLDRLVVAYQISEAMNDLILGQELDKEIWNLLIETFSKLNLPNFRNDKVKIIYYYFFWNLVSLLGYQPQIENFTIARRPVNNDIVKIIKVILKKDWQILPRLKLEPIHLKLLDNISQWYKIKYAPKK